MNQTMYQMNRENSNNERNPFQRNGRSNGYNNNRGGYKDWKKGGSAPYSAYGPPPPPKEKVLTAEDFPSLPGGAPTQAKGVWGLTPPAKPAVKPKEDDSDSDDDPATHPMTLADKMKEILAKEEEARLRGLAEKEEEEEEFYVIPLSNWLRSKHLAKKREEEMKQREAEEEEANYRWQISRQMFPPKPEPSMPEYDEELQEEGYVDGVDVLEEVEER